MKTNAMNCTNEQCGHIGRTGRSAIVGFDGFRRCLLCMLGGPTVSPWHPPIERPRMKS